MYLKSRGYVVPNYWRVARLARVADVDGKPEVIIFYEEAIPDAEFKAPPSPDGNGLSESEAQSPFERMAAAVWPDTGDEKRHGPE